MTSDHGDHVAWFAAARPLYEGLGLAASSILSELLRANGVDFIGIYNRAKTVDSFEEKTKRKAYSNPRSDVTDLCGIRIVTYLQSDVDRVVKLIRSTFNVDDKQSVDKSTALAVDRVGYRSVHIVCTLSKDREILTEYARFAELKLEIQVRTGLQHAWAQIEHDRNYKFGGVLPPELKRRLHLAAGTLELVDSEFDRIARDIGEYAEKIRHEVERGTVAADLNTTSLRLFLSVRVLQVPGVRFVPLTNSDLQTTIVQELIDFGVRSIADVDRLISPPFVKARGLNPDKNRTNEAGLMRDAMMFSDIERYFRDAWKEHWSGIDLAARSLLLVKYDQSVVDDVFSTHNIYIDDEHYNLNS